MNKKLLQDFVNSVSVSVFNELWNTYAYDTDRSMMIYQNLSYVFDELFSTPSELFASLKYSQNSYNVADEYLIKKGYELISFDEFRIDIADNTDVLVDYIINNYGKFEATIEENKDVMVECLSTENWQRLTAKGYSDLEVDELFSRIEKTRSAKEMLTMPIENLMS